MDPSENRLLEEFVEEVSKSLADAENEDEATRVVKKAIPKLLLNQAWLADEYRKPSKEGFTRSLLYRHPDLGFAVVATVWNAGQGTPVHDHGGVWGVEGVFAGSVQVTQYEVMGKVNPEEGDEDVRIREGRRFDAQVGDIECLVPPFGHHRMVNHTDRPAITIHVFGDYPLQPRIYEDKGDGTYGVVIKNRRWDEIEAGSK